MRPYAHNARTHSIQQIRQIADSIVRFGFTNPVLVSETQEIIAGHGRVEAAKLLGMDRVPTLKLSHLSAEERRAYVLADNKLALNGGSDIFDETGDRPVPNRIGQQSAIPSSERARRYAASVTNPPAQPGGGKTGLEGNLGGFGHLTHVRAGLMALLVSLVVLSCPSRPR